MAKKTLFVCLAFLNPFLSPSLFLFKILFSIPEHTPQYSASVKKMLAFGP